MLQSESSGTIQVAVDGRETHRGVRAGTAHDHSGAFCWRIGRRQDETCRGCRQRNKQSCGRPADLSRTDACHSIQHPTTISSGFSKHGIYLVFPAQASAALKTTTEERHRSLFKVPVFQADLKLDATFDLTGVPAAAPQGAELDWSRAEIVVGVSDARGALADATLTTDGKTVTLVPAEIADNIAFGGDENQHVKLTLFGAKVDDIAKPDAQFHATSALAILWRATDCSACLWQDNSSRCAGRLAKSGI